MKHSMSRVDKDPLLKKPMNTANADYLSSLGSAPGENTPGCSKVDRLRAIQELVRSDGYHVPAILVAERMLESAMAHGAASKD